MVFGGLHGGEDGDGGDDGLQTRWQALRVANGMKLLGKGVIKVVQRVDEAKRNNNLDLSGCQLMHVPDAIYFMMKDNALTACNLSSNVITKIPPKFPIEFNFITDLNLANNRMSNIPEEIIDCDQLERLDISRNSFIHIPSCLFSLKKLKFLNAKKNYIADVEIDCITSCPSLECLNLQENPLSRECHNSLEAITSISVKLTPKEIEEWEDLTI